MIDASIKKNLGGFSISAELRDEGCICLAGKNGSGKSSLLRAVSGQTAIDEGFVRVDGIDVTRLPAERRGIVVVTPASSILHLDVDAHLRWGARLRKIPPDDERVSSVKADLGIDFKGKVRTLSLGMKERVSLATALLSSPRVILVDEAFSNLHGRNEFISAYRKLTKEAGIDMVFSSQDAGDGLLADHLYTISEGRTEKVS